MIRYPQFLVDIAFDVQALAEANSDSITALLHDWAAESQELREKHEERKLQNDRHRVAITIQNMQFELLDESDEFWQQFGGKPPNPMPVPARPPELDQPYRTAPVPFNRVLSFLEKVAVLVAIHDTADPTVLPISPFPSPEVARKMGKSEQYITSCGEFQCIKDAISSIPTADSKILDRFFNEVKHSLTPKARHEGRVIQRTDTRSARLRGL